MNAFLPLSIIFLQHGVGKQVECQANEWVKVGCCRLYKCLSTEPYITRIETVAKFLFSAKLCAYKQR